MLPRSRRRLRRFHFPVPSLFTGYPFELTEGEKRELADLESKIGKLKQQKVSKLRELARQKGVSALKLEDLKSECGRPFVEEAGRGSFHIAITKDESSPGHYEFAYLCALQYENLSGAGDKNTCGWVKGAPREEPYDNIGPLCGSAGTRYYCKICGKMVGEFQEVVS